MSRQAEERRGGQRATGDGRGGKRKEVREKSRGRGWIPGKEPEKEVTREGTSSPEEAAPPCLLVFS